MICKLLKYKLFCQLETMAVVIHSLVVTFDRRLRFLVPLVINSASHMGKNLLQKSSTSQNVSINLFICVHLVAFKSFLVERSDR